MSNDQQPSPQQSGEQKLNVNAVPAAFNPNAVPPELQEIFDKAERGEELLPEEENQLLSLEILRLRHQLVVKQDLAKNMVKHLAAVVALRHNGMIMLPKLDYDSFFNRFDAQVQIGSEDITGNRVVQVQLRPKKTQEILIASPQEQQTVEKTRIIVP
jgi:hypothetical protein